MTQAIRRVAIVGGTHGNEWTGIYLVKKFEQFPNLIQRSSFETVTLLANPKAIAANRRYIDRDLNRCFAAEDLSNSALTSYEERRAKEITAQLGLGDRPKVDVIIDLHSTTANMGLTILPSSKHPFNLKLLAHLTTFHPLIRVCYGTPCDQTAPLLRSLSPLGYTIEVGAIAQGVLDANLFQQTEQLIYAILDCLEAMNQRELLSKSSSLTLYQATALLDYPRDLMGDLQAIIHPQLQFKDYEPLYPGDPVFLKWSGEVLSYSGTSTVFPIFINEAAYYEKGIAMVLTEKQEIKLETECYRRTVIQ